MLRTPLLAAMLGLASTVSAQERAAPDLAATVRASIDGDRTGACLAVALVDGDRVQRAYECADRAKARPIGADSAFEIGSVTKPMTAALLAMHIAEGRASLDDPLAKHLPTGAVVPMHGSEPIRLRHLVTHTSGLPPLPPGLVPADIADPYARLTPQALLDALSKTRIDRPPGTRFEYSNFAMMLLSQAVARMGGADVETQLRSRLFAPLGMRGAHVAAVPRGVDVAEGHQSTGAPTPAWNFHRDLAGVGGVRATLDDMVRYVQANLAAGGDTPLDRALAATQAPVATPATPSSIGMNWLRQPWTGGGTLIAHEGGTGGFSSLVAFVPGTRRGVVILSDTSLNALGTLGRLGLHLLDPSNPAPRPRRLAKAPAGLLDALEGRYRLDGGLGMRLWAKDGVLWGQADGQSAFELAYDDAGDFHPRIVDALLSPQRDPDGRYAFRWMQGGGAMLARRVDAGGAPSAPAAVTTGPLEDYVGTYPLAPGFALTVSVDGGRLHVQGTGQSALPVDAIRRDVFGAAVVGAELHFERGADGAVRAVTLRQAGQALRGERQR